MSVTHLHIDRLRIINGRQKDAPALRLGIRQKLETQSWHPEGMPPSAILIVKKFRDPLPGSLLQGRFKAPTVWSKATQKSLSAYYHEAVNPSQGVDARQANAVFFNDEAEMIACFLRDLARGRVDTFWWWKALSRQFAGEGGGESAKVLRVHIDKVPSIMHLLKDWGAIKDVLILVPEFEAKQLVQDLATTFHVPALLQASVQQPTEDSSKEGLNLEVKQYAVLNELTAIATRHSLHIEQLKLLGLACSLHRIPSRVCTGRFQSAWTAWVGHVVMRRARPDTQRSKRHIAVQSQQPPTWRDAVELQGAINLSTESFPSHQGLEVTAEVNRKQLSASNEGQKASSPASPAPLSEKENAGREETTRLNTRNKNERQQHTRRMQLNAGAPELRVTQPEPVELHHHAPDFPEASGVNSGAEISSPSMRVRQSENTPSENQPSIRSAPFSRESSMSPTETQRSLQHMLDQHKAWELHFGRPQPLPFEQGVHTELGGILYLINVMQALNVPACFEEDWQLESEIGPWGVLELLARGLLGAGIRTYNDDAIWSALVSLDNRPPGQLPGEAYSCDAPFKTPPTWGAKHHPPQKMSKYLVEELNPDLARWLAGVLPFIARRIREALDLSRASMLKSFLMLPSTLYLTSSHVDLVIPINWTSILVRLAGLDQNPGWLPMYGRVVLFHFD